jgi:hypothetical protein
MPTLRNCVLAYKCPNDWDALPETDNSDVKFCNECQKEVYFCHDDEDLAKGIRLNRCVAFFKPSELSDLSFTATMGVPTFPLPKEHYIKKLIGLGLQEKTLRGLEYEDISLIWNLLDNSKEIDEID